jgi:hypothetical protein
MLAGMSAQEQSYLGVTHKPRSSAALPAPVTAAAGSARLQLAAQIACEDCVSPGVDQPGELPDALISI